VLKKHFPAPTVSPDAYNGKVAKREKEIGL